MRLSLEVLLGYFIHENNKKEMSHFLYSVFFRIQCLDHFRSRLKVCIRWTDVLCTKMIDMVRRDKTTILYFRILNYVVFSGRF